MERGRLCLTRRDGQSILIGDDIEVTAVESVNGKTRLLIEAPKSVRVHRREVYERIQDEAACR